MAEAAKLGVLQPLLDAAARITPTWVHYDARGPTEVSLANRIPTGMMHPAAPGSLNLYHPESCSTLAQVARDLGVRLEREVTDVVVHAGRAPTVSGAAAAGQTVEFGLRLVIGADGRNSTVQRKVVDRTRMP